MFEHFIDDNLISADDKIAVGVSGGADSMLLLWALFDKQKKLGFEMWVVHVNHGIRNETSDRDQKFVEEFCKKRKIGQISVKIDAKTCKIKEKYTLEEAARRLRYDAFERVMKEKKLNKLFLAHHKNDQAETILMHLFRGAGIDGASGMSNSGKIVRPLLNLTKTEILKICDDGGISFVEDETNQDNSYARNFVRNDVVPLIEKCYPAVIENICAFGKRCGEVKEFVESLVSPALIEHKDGQVLIKSEAFKNHSVLVREYIKSALKTLSVFEDIEAKHYDLVAGLDAFEVGKKVDLPKGLVAQKTYSGVKIFRPTKKAATSNEFEFVVGKIVFGKFIIETKIVSGDEVEYGNGKLFVDYNKISNGAIWRVRKLGDTFAKLGTGSKKLNDYFTDKKFETEKRNQIPLLAIGNKILVVAGEDISENVKIDAATDKIVSIEISKN